MLGKRDSCQVAGSISLTSNQGSLPAAWQLYLPEDWAGDAKRRTKAGVPEEVRFATKTHIALQQLRTLLAQCAPHHCVLADAGYGVAPPTSQWAAKKLRLTPNACSSQAFHPPRQSCARSGTWQPRSRHCAST